MHKIGVVLTDTDDWTAAAILKNIRDKGAEALALNLAQIGVSITNAGLYWLNEVKNKNKNKNMNGMDGMDGMDGIIVRDVGISNLLDLISVKFDLIRIFEIERRTTVMNSSMAIQNAANKFLSFVLFQRAHLPLPPTVVTADLEVAKRAIEDFGSVLVKPIFGSQGKGIIKLEGYEYAPLKVAALLKDRGVLYLQQFVHNPGRDIRVFVVGETALGAIYRVTPPGSFRSNLSQGGSPRKCELTEELCELAVRATKAVGADFAGVDLIESADGLYLLEINATPSERGIKLTCGIDVTEKIVDLLFTRLKR